MAEPTQRNVIELIWKSVDESSVILKSMGNTVGKFGDTLSSISGPAANFTTGLLKMEAGLVAMGLAMGGYAVNEAGKFDASMRELSTLIGGGEQGAQDFATAIAEMGSRSLVPLEDLTGAMYKATSQMGNLEDAQKIVTIAEKLSVAGRADLTETTLLLMGALEAYGKTTQDAGKFSDVLFSIVQNGQTTLTELAAGFGGLTPTASKLGVSMESLGASVALITKSAIPTSEALTGLKAVLANVLNPSKDAADMAAQLGINFTAAGLKSKGFAGFLVDVAQKTGGSVEKMGALFGSMEAFNVVMALSAEGGSKFTAMLKNIEQSTGATQKAYDLMAGAFGAGNQVILNNLKILAIAFGTPLLDPVRHVQEALTNFFLLLHGQIMKGELNEFFAAARLSIDGFAASIEMVTKNLPAAFAKVDFGPLKEQIKLLGDAFGSIGGNIDLTSVDGLAKALQAVVDGITRFIAINRGLLEALPAVFETLTSIGKTLLELDPAWFKFAGVILGSLTVLDKAKGAFDLLKGTMEGLGGLLGDDGKKGGKALPSLFKVLTTSIEGVVKVAPVATYALSALTLAAGYYVGTILSDWDMAHTKAKTGFSGVGEALYYLTHDAIPPAVMSTREHTNATYEWSLSQGKANDILTDSFAKWDANSQKIEAARDKTKELTGITDEVAQRTQRLAEGFARMGRSGADAAELALRGFTMIDKYMNTMTGYKLVNDVFVQIGQSAKDAGEVIETAMEKAFKETQKAKDKAEEFRLEWAKLAAEERNIVFQASADIQVAHIESQAAQAVAAFESISAAIESTGETMSSLVSTWAEIESGKFFDKSFVKSLIEDEMELRKKSFELQKELVTSQKRYLDAATERLKGKDALITIQGDGLKPELEAFMFKILETIQIEASQNGASFLLGLPNV